MPIDVQCSGCRACFQVPDRPAATLIRCKTCGKEFRMAGGAPVDGLNDETLARPPRPHMNSLSSAIVFVGGVLLVGLVIAGGAGVWFWFTPKPPPHDTERLVRKRNYPAGTFPVMTFSREFHSEEDDPPDIGKEIAVLSKLRHAPPDADGNVSYDVDYSFPDARPSQTDKPRLRIRTLKETGGTPLAPVEVKAHGTWRIVLLQEDESEGRIKIDVWLEKKPRLTRQRISNVISLN
jgi:hypothetical protein